MNKKLFSIAISVALIAPGLAGAQVDTKIPPVPPLPTNTGQLPPNGEKLGSPFKAIQEIRDTKREELKNLREEEKEANKDLREKVKEEQEAIKDQVKNLREETKQKIESAREEIKTGMVLAPEAFKAFEAKREELKTQFEAKREEAKQIIETKKEEAKQIIETKREELKQKLEVVKDEKKKEVAGKVFEDLNKLNAKTLENMTKAVDQIESVLNRILSRSEKVAVNGENNAGVVAAGEAAKVAIGAARTAIQDQTAKVYSVTVSTEKTLKADLGKVRDSLRSDLEVVKTKVKAARDAVQSAATTLAQIPKVDTLEVSKEPAQDSSTSVSSTNPVNQ